MIKRVVNLIDERLRALHGITEFTNSQSCIFRMQVTTCEHGFLLADGTPIATGSRIIVLHLWNEHVPPFPSAGPTLSWARHMSCALDNSLSELERHLSARPDLDDILFIRAEMAFATTERRNQLLALAGKYGFEPVKPTKQSLLRRFHRLGENILLAMLVLANNPASFRADTLRRSCTSIFASRASLRRRADNPRKVVIASNRRVV
ncbi:MAG: hypothetical protein KGL35_06325 [Bradyrhizobium sp.]|uniref:YkoP family protein n=1 Tax=Bradyrhizobium sp. TaxID=376 RepID=UPI001C2889B0|nr:hypothetical protein [Bradyrhizobium sp.]MBU6462566.1 hypothetical protein [Pseudomonadota bacterium]MDE2067187.1 hypothetical protein [Bradyrhizobium sp.]MDE2468354.1 hypothetical protein [Bradyrhizobium sp.]